jgi:hypothetical protein
MPDADYTEIVILCEDRQQATFARHFLTLYLKIRHPRRIREVLPVLGGSGEQFVRKQIVEEVKMYRRNRHRKNIALVVITDADILTLEIRRKMLSDALDAAEINPIEDSESIAIFIPKHEIETWIDFLETQNAVDEHHQYLPHQKAHFATVSKPLAETLAKNCLKNEPLSSNAPASLKAACDELARIPRPQ